MSSIHLSMLPLESVTFAEKISQPSHQPLAPRFPPYYETTHGARTVHEVDTAIEIYQT